MAKEVTRREFVHNTASTAAMLAAGLDGIEILRELHHSSRSHLYLAVDTDSQRQVALKVPSVDMRDDVAYLERFMMEEWVARRLKDRTLPYSDGQVDAALERAVSAARSTWSGDAETAAACSSGFRTERVLFISRPPAQTLP